MILLIQKYYIHRRFPLRFATLQQLRLPSRTIRSAAANERRRIDGRAQTAI